MRAADEARMTQTLTKSSVDYANLVARGVRILVDAKIMDFNGHVSARDANDPNIFYINNRHAGRSSVSEADIVPFDIAAGKRVGEGIEPPSEWHIHREIYQRYPKAGGIVHCHPKTIVTLTAAGQKLKPINSIGTFIPEEGAPLFDSPVLINSVARGKGMADAFGDSPIGVLRQHGAVTVGEYCEQAVIRMICAEDNAQTQYAALQIGTPLYMHGEELRLMSEEHAGPHGIKKYWTYYEETARRNGALEGI